MQDGVDGIMVSEVHAGCFFGGGVSAGGGYPPQMQAQDMCGCNQHPAHPCVRIGSIHHSQHAAIPTQKFKLAAPMSHSRGSVSGILSRSSGLVLYASCQSGVAANQPLTRTRPAADNPRSETAFAAAWRIVWINLVLALDKLKRAGQIMVVLVLVIIAGAGGVEEGATAVQVVGGGDARGKGGGGIGKLPPYDQVATLHCCWLQARLASRLAVGCDHTFLLPCQSLRPMPPMPSSSTPPPFSLRTLVVSAA